MIALVLLAVALVVASAFGSALAMRWDRLSLGIGTGGVLGGCAVGASASAFHLLHGGEDAQWTARYSLPAGRLHVGLDGLSAFFLLCVFVVSGLGALYGAGYMSAYVGKRRLAPAVAFFNLLVGAMAVLVLARDGVLFLLAWEVMSVASFFLVVYEHEREDV